MKNIIFILTCVIFLTCCSPSATPTTPTSTLPPTKPNPSYTPSATRTPANTRTTTVTPTRTIAFPTATYDAIRAVTKTSQPPAQCPIQNPGINPNIAEIISKEHFYRLGSAVLEYLNAGGIMSKLTIPITVYSEFWKKNITFTTDIFKEDLTGDGIPEVILRDWVELFIFSCQGGKYQTLLSVDTNEPTFYHTGATLLKAQDINRDGLPELLIGQGSCGTCVADDYRVLEWDGSSFSNILGNENYHSPYGNIIRGHIFPEVLMVDGFAYTDPSIHPTIIRDLDHNGIKELIFMGGIPSSYDARYHGPWRVETVTFSWNGSLYVVTDWRSDVPHFRFQAAQDGDVYASLGKYDQALASYRQVIVSNTLDFWSSERRQYQRDLLDYSYSDSTTPSPVMPDAIPAEYPNLAAYSYYKTMLLHVIQGHLPEAQVVYDTLQSKFPSGTEGSIYAELARIFWGEYQVSTDIGTACSKVIEKVNTSRSIYFKYLGNIVDDFTYLSSNIFGWWSLYYTPQDVCPFP